jgi:para-nitrobenzyl esterase
MRSKLLLAWALAALAPTVAFGQPAATPAGGHYTTQDTEIGVLLDDPAAKAVLEKDAPDVAHSDQIDMARGMTLRAIQQYAPEQLTDAVLAKLDVDLAKLPPKSK